MRTIAGQVLASTSVDSQGESLSKEDLEELLSISPDPFPLNFQHDMAEGYVGYARNLRIEKTSDDPIHYVLKADVEVEDAAFDSVVAAGMGGFSWSLTVPLKRNYGEEEQPDVMIYLPWPSYRDEALVARLLGCPPNTFVGKWVKKGLTSEQVALIASALIFGLSPFWQDVYDQRIAPVLRNSYEQIKLLWDRRIDTVHVFSTQYGTNIECFIFLNPDNNDRVASCSIANFKKGLNTAIVLLQERISRGLEPIKCTMLYSSKSDHWSPVSIHYRGGTYENFP